MKRPLQILTCAILAAVTLTARADLADPTPRLYKLGPDSTYESGCFLYCACPIVFSGLEGTFILTFIEFDGLFWRYEVSDVQWTAFPEGPGLPITGSGAYRVGGEFAAMHQLELDLVIGDEPEQHFDSGLIVGGSDFPVIDIAVCMNQLQCYDTLLTLHARPAGDVNGDGEAEMGDLAPFVDVLLGQDSDPDHMTFADMTLDDQVDGSDIRPFVETIMG